MSENEGDETSPSARAEADKFLGRVLAGKYRIDKFVGGGAMGKVYRATQVLLDKTVAIKVLHAALGADETFTSRFQREARAASRIEHPNSVQIFDFGIEPDGLMYIAMEFLNGKDLHKAIYAEWPLSIERVVDLMSQTLSALAVAHDQGIVHRDLKPENIMIVPRPGDDGTSVETVKVADFGIAKLVDNRSGTGTKLTQQGLVAGTPEYMSPEQAQAKELDGRSDLYACGVILFQMVTGRLPFEGETAIAVVLKHLTEPAPRASEFAPGLDPALDALIHRALAKAPAERFQNAREMRSALRALLSLNDATTAGLRSSTLAPEPRPPQQLNIAPTALDTPSAPDVPAARERLPTGATTQPNGSLATPSAGPGTRIDALPPLETAGAERPVPTPPRTSPSALTGTVEAVGAEPRGPSMKAMAAMVLGVAALSAVAVFALGRRGGDPAVAAPNVSASASSAPSASAGSNGEQGASAVANVVASAVASALANASALASAQASASASASAVANVVASAQASASAEQPSAAGRGPRPTPQRGARQGPGEAATATPSAAPTVASAAPPAPSATAAPPPPSAAPPPPSAAPTVAALAPLRGVGNSVGSLTVGGGLTARPLQPRAAAAAHALAECAEREARSRGNGAGFTAATTATVTIDVRDRRADAVRVGGAGWLAGCSSAVRGAFQGDLPASDDSEYAISFQVTLTPER